MITRRSDLAMWILIVMLGAQGFVQIGQVLSRSALANEAGANEKTRVASYFDESWEAIEFLGHSKSEIQDKLLSDVTFQHLEGRSTAAGTTIQQKFIGRDQAENLVTCVKLATVKSGQGQAVGVAMTTVPTLMVTKWRVFGHVHAQ